jgi:tetratricopeptide (TPR) repeat protein
MMRVRVRLASAIGIFLAWAALATTPAVADSWQDCMQSKDPDLAIDGCTNFLATAQGDEVIQGHYGRAVAYFNKHDYYHAVKDFDVVITKRPLQGAYINRGLAYEGQIADDPAFADQAISDLTEAANLQPGVDDKTRGQFWGAYLTRAIENLKRGKDAQALEDEGVAIQLNPDKAIAIKADFAQAYEQRAGQNLAGGRYDGAVSDFRQAIQLDPTTADKLAPYLTEAQSRHPGPYAAIVRGNQHEEDHDYEQALIDFTEAIHANPHLAEAHLGRGHACRALDHFENAREEFDEAIRLAPKDWRGFYASGRLYQSTNQFENAAKDFDQASAIVEEVRDPGYQAEKYQIERARKSLEFSSTTEGHWISYLKEIQAANTYVNWSDKPYDLYLKEQGLQHVARPLLTYRLQDTRHSNTVVGVWVTAITVVIVLVIVTIRVHRYRVRHAGVSEWWTDGWWQRQASGSRKRRASTSVENWWETGPSKGEEEGKSGTAGDWWKEKGGK